MKVKFINVDGHKELAVMECCAVPRKGEYVALPNYKDWTVYSVHHRFTVQEIALEGKEPIRIPKQEVEIYLED
jgi:hypothetical protein